MVDPHLSYLNPFTITLVDPHLSHLNHVTITMVSIYCVDDPHTQPGEQFCYKELCYLEHYIHIYLINVTQKHDQPSFSQLDQLPPVGSRA